jgi:hypothetical protein
MGSDKRPGDNQQQNEQARTAARMCNLSMDGQEELKRRLEQEVESLGWSEVLAEAEAIAALGGKYVNR